MVNSNTNRFHANTKIVTTLQVWSRILHDKQVLPQAVKTFPCTTVFTTPAISVPSDISVQSTHSPLFKTHFNIILNKRAGFEMTFSLHVWSPSFQMHFSAPANNSTAYCTQRLFPGLKRPRCEANHLGCRCQSLESLELYLFTVCKVTGYKERTACFCTTHGRFSVPTAHNGGTNSPYGRPFHVVEQEYRP